MSTGVSYQLCCRARTGGDEKEREHGKNAEGMEGLVDMRAFRTVNCSAHAEGFLVYPTKLCLLLKKSGVRPAEAQPHTLTSRL